MLGGHLHNRLLFVIIPWTRAPIMLQHSASYVRDSIALSLSLP